MRVYRTFSFLQTVLFIVLKLACLAGIVFSVLLYKENPILFIVLIALCILFFIVIGPDEMVVYTDRLEYKRVNMLNIVPKKQCYYFKDMQSISCTGEYATGDEWYSSDLRGDKKLNQVIIELKDGSNRTINTSIYINKLKGAIRIIQKRL